MYDGIIFDIDGTLWDARVEVTESWNIALNECGYDIKLDPIELGKLFGKTMSEIFSIIFPDMDDDEKDKIICMLFKYQHQYIAEKKPKAYEGTEETLRELCKRYKLYIVTNAQKGYIEALFTATGLQKYFADWMCYGDTLAPKNVTIQKLCEKNNIKKPVYIGDTQGDADQCEIVGIPMIYAAYGLGEVKNPRSIIHDITDLTKMI